MIVKPEWGLDPINTGNTYLSPRISYHVWFPVGNYRIWVCGMGGTVNDDSLHMGLNYVPRSTSDRISGYNSTNWVWKSLTIDGPVHNYIDIWARENGMRVDRILLTRDFNFNPATAK